jgi:hypothetical protein
MGIDHEERPNEPLRVLVQCEDPLPLLPRDHALERARSPLPLSLSA